MKKVSSNGVFVGRNGRFDIVMNKYYFDIHFNGNGAYRTVNRYFYHKGIFGAYNILVGGIVETDNISANVVRVYGNRVIKIASCIDGIFDFPKPSFDHIERQTNKEHRPVKGNVVEIYNFDDFKAVVYRNHSDDTLPHYGKLTLYFGKALKYLGKPSVRFIADEPEKMPYFASNIIKGDFKSFYASNGDCIVMQDKFITQIFRNVDLPEYREITCFGDSDVSKLLSVMTKLNNRLEFLIRDNNELRKENANLHEKVDRIENSLFDEAFNAMNFIGTTINDFDSLE